MVQKSDLPFGSEFSPSQIELPELLEPIPRSVSEILNEIDPVDHNVNGLALKVTVFKLMDLLDLRFAAAYPRAEATDRSEAGLIFESEQPVFSRWQVQCKKTELLTVDDVAREVGLTYLLKSNVIVMICTGAIEDTVRHYTDAVMRNTNLCIVMLDGADLHAISADPTHIKQLFRRETQRAKGLRPLSI